MQGIFILEKVKLRENGRRGCILLYFQVMYSWRDPRIVNFLKSWVVEFVECNFWKDIEEGGDLVVEVATYYARY